MENKRIEVICCGLCPCRFKSRMELYQHFHNRHTINQEFRGYSGFIPTDNNNIIAINGNEKTKIQMQDNHTTVPAPDQIQIDGEMNDIQKILPIIPTSKVPLHNSGIQNYVEKENVSNVDEPSSLQKNIPSTDKLTESQVRFDCNNESDRTFTRNLATGTMLNMHHQTIVGSKRIEPKATLHYYPTSADLLRGGTFLFLSFAETDSVLKKTSKALERSLSIFQRKVTIV